MKTSIAFVIAVLAVGCADATDSRTDLTTLDPAEMEREVEADVVQQAQQVIDAERIGEFECDIGRQHCWLDGFVYECGQDGGEYDYFATGRRCDNAILFLLDPDDPRVDARMRESVDLQPWLPAPQNRSDVDDTNTGSQTDPAPSSGGSSSGGSSGGGAPPGGTGGTGTGGSSGGGGGHLGGA